MFPQHSLLLLGAARRGLIGWTADALFGGGFDHPKDILRDLGAAALAYLEGGEVDPGMDSNGYREMEAAGLCLDAELWEQVLLGADLVQEEFAELRTQIAAKSA